MGVLLAGGTHRHPVEHWLSWDPTDLANGEATKAARANAIEAAAIASDIRELHDAAGKPWSSFAILLRARKSLEVYLEALRRAGVPYAVQRDRSYYRRREVIDLACAVRAILDPADQLALVAFLRSPLVGVPDAAWIPLWRSGFAAAMVELERPVARRILLEAGPVAERIEAPVLREVQRARADAGLAAVERLNLLVHHPANNVGLIEIARVRYAFSHTSKGARPRNDKVSLRKPEMI